MKLVAGVLRSDLGRKILQTNYREIASENIHSLQYFFNVEKKNLYHSKYKSKNGVSGRRGNFYMSLHTILCVLLYETAVGGTSA